MKQKIVISLIIVASLICLIVFVVANWPCNHSFITVITEEATCESDGVKKMTCKKCDFVYTELISRTGHNWKSSTCTSPKTCLKCSKTYGEALGHKYDFDGQCTNCSELAVGAEEYVVFKDVFLEQLIKKNIGISGANKISKYHIKKITYLTIDNDGIRSLSGLEHAVNLESIYISVGYLSDLEVLCKLPNLKTIKIGEPINVSFMKKMKYLESVTIYQSIAGGSIYDIVSSPNLKHLSIDLFGVRASGHNIDFLRGKNNLETLYLNDVARDTTDFSVLLELPNLKSLRIRLFAYYGGLNTAQKNVCLKLIENGVYVDIH